MKVFAKDQPGLAPAAAHPDITVAAVSPVAAYPNRVRVRAGRPTSSCPNPVAAPFPATRNPKPKVQRSGGRRHDFNLRRRRSLRLFHNNLPARRRSRLHHGHGAGRAFHKAAREQRQADGDQNAFG